MRLAHELKERVTILQRIDVEDPDDGTRRPTWVPLATVWASVKDILPARGETEAHGVTQAMLPKRVRIRFRVGITSEMRFQYRDPATLTDQIMRINSGPAELGRREGMEFRAEVLSTEGTEP